MNRAQITTAAGKLPLQMVYTGGSLYTQTGFQHLLASLGLEEQEGELNGAPLRMIDLSAYQSLEELIHELMRTVSLNTHVRFITNPSEAISILAEHFMPECCLNLQEPLSVLGEKILAVAGSQPNLTTILAKLRPVRDLNLLSVRQKQVLAGLKKNSSILEIAHELNISDKSVYTYISTIRHSFGFRCEQKFREFLYHT